MKNVFKSIPKELRPLAAEARKNRTAEEFVNNQKQLVEDYKNGTLQYRDNNGVLNFKRDLTDGEKVTYNYITSEFNKPTTMAYKFWQTLDFQLTDIYNQAKKSSR